MIIGCDKETVGSMRANDSEVQQISLDINEEKTINPPTNSEVSKPISIKFVEVKEGRCAVEQCSACYGGYVNIFLTVKVGDVTDSLSLSRISCIGNDDLKAGNPLLDKKTIQGLSVGLINVSELRQSNPISKYNVKLSIDVL